MGLTVNLTESSCGGILEQRISWHSGFPQHTFDEGKEGKEDQNLDLRAKNIPLYRFRYWQRKKTSQETVNSSRA